MTVVWILTLVAVAAAALLLPPATLERFQQTVWSNAEGFVNGKTSIVAPTTIIPDPPADRPDEDGDDDTKKEM